MFDLYAFFVGEHLKIWGSVGATPPKHDFAVQV